MSDGGEIYVKIYSRVNNAYFSILMMNVWIWAVGQENWPIVKDKKVWSISKGKKTERVQVGDRIVFYLIGTKCFCGIYEVIRDWDAPTIEWADADVRKEDYLEIGLNEIQLGMAPIISANLDFIIKKAPKSLGTYLVSCGNLGASNKSMPISVNDYNTILKGLKQTENEVDKFPLISGGGGCKKIKLDRIFTKNQS